MQNKKVCNDDLKKILQKSRIIKNQLYNNIYVELFIRNL